MPIEILSRGKTGSRNLNKRIQAINTALDARQLKQLPTYTVATLPAASLANERSIVHVSNGNAGAACLAISDGTNWKVIAIGANVAAA